MDKGFFYSAKNNAFYAEALKDDYEAGTEGWPADAVAISDEEHTRILAGMSEGKVLTHDSSGRPTLTAAVIDRQSRAEQQRQTLIDAANATTADWRTELQLDIISDYDRASLVKWMAYIKTVKALDIPAVKDEATYNSIAWPEQPETV